MSLACTADAVGDEFCCLACVFCIEVRLHHATLTLLHWLKVPEHIEFKLAVLFYRCLHETAPPYLAEELHRGSSQSSALHRHHRLLSHARLSTIGDRAAFPVTAARLWNTLLLNVTLASSMSFRKHLKTHLFSHSFSESPVVPVQWLCHFGHYNQSFYLLTLLTAAGYVSILQEMSKNMGSKTHK